MHTSSFMARSRYADGVGHLAIYRDREGFLRALNEHVRPLS